MSDSWSTDATAATMRSARSEVARSDTAIVCSLLLPSLACNQLRQQSALSILPRVLVLHLKRFQFNEKTFTFRKRKDIVKFDQIIDMSEYVTDDVELPHSSQ